MPQYISADTRYDRYTALNKKTRDFLAARLKIPFDKLTLTCGATGGIDASLSLLATSSTLALMPFEYFDVHALAEKHGIRIVQQHTKTRKNDMALFTNFVKQEKPNAIYFSLPNNPLGQTYTKQEILMLINATDKRCLILIDQTLVAKQMIEPTWLCRNFPNHRIILIRSFSKTHGCVAERIGYTISLGNVPSLHPYAHAPAAHSLRTALRVFPSTKERDACLKRISENSNLLKKWARRQKGIDWSNSRTNFGALHFSEDVHVVIQKLAERGIVTKTQNELRCTGNFIRINLNTKTNHVIGFLKSLHILSS